MSFDLIPVHKIKETGRVHEKGVELLVNLHFITYIDNQDDGVCIELATGSVLYIEETFEELERLIGYVHSTWTKVLKAAE